MPDLLTATGLDALTTTEPDGFVLWYRPHRGREPWQAVYRATTSSECVRNIGIGGRRGGGWLVKPAGQHPDR